MDFSYFYFSTTTQGIRLRRRVAFFSTTSYSRLRLGRGLPLYQLASWSIHPFGHNRLGPKRVRGCCATLGGAGSLTYIHKMWPGPEACYLSTNWHLHPFSSLATRDMGQKLGRLQCPTLVRATGNSRFESDKFPPPALKIPKIPVVKNTTVLLYI